MKTLLKNLIVSFIILICFSFNSYGQVEDEIRISFNINQQDILHEKLFLHTDKSNYLTGEILWFRIFYVDANNNKPLHLSKVAYVEVLDQNQNSVLQAKIPLTGKCAGSFVIPANIANGNYNFRAYTSWMKNFSADAYFQKEITIINPSVSPEQTVNKFKPIYNIQFFPEGGNLVDGLTNKVAFKVTDQSGRGTDFKAILVAESRDTVLKFQPLKFGMGNFIFKPSSKKTYHAIFFMSGESKPVTQNLPIIYKQGYVLAVKETDPQLNINVASNNQDEQIYLLIYSGNKSQAIETNKLKNGSTGFTINKDLLADGVSHIVVFNSVRQPVCERLYFKNPVGKISLSVSSNRQNYTLRKKVEVDVSAKSVTGNPLALDFSTAVYQVDSLQGIDPINITNYLLLTSELRGSVESPGYYFNENPSVKEATDNLMLAQGWSRFNWEQISKNSKPSFSFLPEYEGQIISAKIINTTTNHPAKNITSYLSVPGKQLQFYISKSDSAGKLLFNTKDFYGTGEVVLQTNDQKDSTYRIDLLNSFSEDYANHPAPIFTLSDATKSDLKSRFIDIQVQNSYFKNQISRFFDPRIDSSAFYGKLFVPYLLEDYTRFPTMYEVLHEYVKSVLISKQQKKFHLKVITEKTVLDGEPTVLLDGVPVFDMDKLMDIDPLKIRKLELVKNDYFWQADELQGILNFTSYKGDLAGYEINPKAVIVDYDGLHLEREFYSPVYETQNQIASRLPDFRNVLYWSPSNHTDGSGHAHLSFYTSDKAAKYVGIVQGITANGEVGYQYFYFDVKPEYNANDN